MIKTFVALRRARQKALNLIISNRTIQQVQQVYSRC